MMDPHWTWIFARDDQRIELTRIEADGECRLAIDNGHGGPRSYRFDDMITLVNFQGDMESFLLNTGWLLAEFRPERRTGRERRTWPRMRDRRRWWTDGVPAQAREDARPADAPTGL